MKKLLALALCVVSVAALAQDPDWSVSNEDGNIYTLLPQTAKKAVSGDLQYVTAIVEGYNKSQEEPQRFRIGVTGCGSSSGRIVFANVSGTKVFRKDDWVVGGARVYDILAQGACAAELLNSRPTKQKDNWGNGSSKTY